jgi:hypothetical protein
VGKEPGFVSLREFRGRSNGQFELQTANPAKMSLTKLFRFESVATMKSKLYLKLPSVRLHRRPAKLAAELPHGISKSSCRRKSGVEQELGKIEVSGGTLHQTTNFTQRFITR